MIFEYFPTLPGAKKETVPPPRGDGGHQGSHRGEHLLFNSNITFSLDVPQRCICTHISSQNGNTRMHGDQKVCLIYHSTIIENIFYQVTNPFATEAVEGYSVNLNCSNPGALCALITCGPFPLWSQVDIIDHKVFHLVFFMGRPHNQTRI